MDTLKTLQAKLKCVTYSKDNSITKHIIDIIIYKNLEIYKVIAIVIERYFNF